MFTMTSEGSEDHEDVEYDDDSYAACTDCEWDGKVRDLQTDAE